MTENDKNLELYNVPIQNLENKPSTITSISPENLKKLSDDNLREAEALFEDDEYDEEDSENFDPKEHINMLDAVPYQRHVPDKDKLQLYLFVVLKAGFKWTSLLKSINDKNKLVSVQEIHDNIKNKNNSKQSMYKSKNKFLKEYVEKLLDSEKNRFTIDSAEIGFRPDLHQYFKVSVIGELQSDIPGVLKQYRRNRVNRMPHLKSENLLIFSQEIDYGTPLRTQRFSEQITEDTWLSFHRECDQEAEKNKPTSLMLHFNFQLEVVRMTFVGSEVAKINHKSYRRKLNIQDSSKQDSFLDDANQSITFPFSQLRNNTIEQWHDEDNDQQWLLMELTEWPKFDQLCANELGFDSFDTKIGHETMNFLMSPDKFEEEWAQYKKRCANQNIDCKNPIFDSVKLVSLYMNKFAFLVQIKATRENHFEKLKKQFDNHSHRIEFRPDDSIQQQIQNEECKHKLDSNIQINDAVYTPHFEKRKVNFVKTTQYSQIMKLYHRFNEQNWQVNWKEGDNTKFLLKSIMYFKHLISFNYISVFSLNDSLVNEILNWKDSEYFLKQLSIRKSIIEDVRKEFSDFQTNQETNEIKLHEQEVKRKSQSESHFYWIQTVLVCTSHIKVAFPELMTENNLFNEVKNPNMILNVNLSLDNKKSIMSDQNAEDVSAQLRKFMDEINIFSIKYNMFNQSDSKLKSKGFQAIEKNEKPRLKELLANEPNQYKSMAKLCSAFGLNSSSCIFSRVIDDKLVCREKDVKNGNTVFSDGVGTITPLTLYQKVLNNKPPSQRYNYTAIQVRVNGCKGMLTLQPQDAKGEEDQDTDKIIVRESMVKSWKDWKRVQVVKLADRLSGTINRQIIINMVAIDPSLKPKLWARIIEHYNLLLKMPFDASIARKIINQRPDITVITTLKDIMQDDTYQLQFISDPFYFSQILGITLNMLQLMKQKTKFLIPLSTRLKGVLDEQGILKEDQIQFCVRIFKGEFKDLLTQQVGNARKGIKNANGFKFYKQVTSCFLEDPVVSIQKEKIKAEDDEHDPIEAMHMTDEQIDDLVGRWADDVAFQAVEGSIMLAKNPSLQVGDVKKVTAVIDHRLSHQRNVLVFNRKGKKPLPTQISQSDLDGDEQQILQDQSLIQAGSNREGIEQDVKAEFQNKHSNFDVKHKEYERLSIEANLQANMLRHIKAPNIGQVCNLLLSHQDNLNQVYDEQKSEKQMKLIRKLTKDAMMVIDSAKQDLRVSIQPEHRLKIFPFFVDINKSTLHDSHTIIASTFKLIEIDQYLETVNTVLKEAWMKAAGGATSCELKLREDRKTNLLQLRSQEWDPTKQKGYNFFDWHAFKREINVDLSLFQQIQEQLNEQQDKKGDEEGMESLLKYNGLMFPLIAEQERMVDWYKLEFDFHYETEFFLKDKVLLGEKVQGGDENFDHLQIVQECDRLLEGVKDHIENKILTKVIPEERPKLKQRIAIESYQQVQKNFLTWDNTDPNSVEPTIYSDIKDFNFELNVRLNTLIHQNQESFKYVNYSTDQRHESIGRKLEKEILSFPLLFFPKELEKFLRFCKQRSEKGQGLYQMGENEFDELIRGKWDKNQNDLEQDETGIVDEGQEQEEIDHFNQDQEDMSKEDDLSKENDLSKEEREAKIKINESFSCGSEDEE